MQYKSKIAIQVKKGACKNCTYDKYFHYLLKLSKRLSIIVYLKLNANTPFAV